MTFDIVTIFPSMIERPLATGIVGRAIYEGDFTPFWKFLRFGQCVYMGHGSTWVGKVSRSLTREA